MFNVFIFFKLVFIFCFSSVYSDSEMNKELSEKMDDPTKVETAKLKRDSWPHHSIPCPLHYNKGWLPKPEITIVKPPHFSVSKYDFLII